MTVEELYARRKLRPALEFEDEVLAMGRVRGSGTTTRMVAMVVLDLMAGWRFHITAAMQAEAQRIRTSIFTMSQSIPTSQKLVLDVVPPKQYVQGTRYYRDHYRDAIADEDVRVHGPLGWASAVFEERRGVFAVQDREGELIAHITKTGFDQLSAAHFLRLRVP